MPDEDDLAVDIKVDKHLEGDTVGMAAHDAVGEESEQSTEDGYKFGLDEDDDLNWISDFNNIKERYGDEFMKALMEAEKHAVKKDVEFLGHYKLCNAIWVIGAVILLFHITIFHHLKINGSDCFVCPQPRLIGQFNKLLKCQTGPNTFRTTI